MINKNDLIAIAHVAIIGCVTPALRMLKVLYSEPQMKVMVVAYFDDVPKVYEQELISDISGEIESSLVDSRYECRAACVCVADPVVGSVDIENFERNLCESISFSEICYLRFGEEGGHEDLTSDSYVELDVGAFYRLS